MKDQLKSSNKRLIDCLKTIRKHIKKMETETRGKTYDWNGDPMSMTLIQGWINTALDSEDFCPDWMCQSECPAREALKEHLQVMTKHSETKEKQ